MNTLLYFFLYFILINIFSFFLMKIDKKKSIKKQSRISEFTLYLVSLLGGSIGTLLGMQIFRHKTKKNSFIFVIVIIIFIQCVLFYKFIDLLPD
ncbi:DUF1294 domain-containing protein [Empedobacter sedimenti]|uniref:DUF1294 domain-containing protein n=1 Tax=Empedobacter sedimenti TaxID=3042610 RepID=UPI0024A77E03|nr:DUF1294 domain-containing protein [Empedobacter sedimenti]